MIDITISGDYAVLTKEQMEQMSYRIGDDIE